MTLSPEAIAAEAALLDSAERDRTQIRQTTSVYPEATIADAYAIQAAWREVRLGRGETMIGHKIGLTSKAMQSSMQISTPDSGFLTDVMAFDASDGPVEIAAADHLDPKIEVELAFVLSSDLDGAGIGFDEVVAATDYVVPALELIAARSHRVDPETQRRRTVVDTIADNAANAAIIVGGERRSIDDVDLRWVGALLDRNGEIEESGLAAAVLNHPVNGIVWLARRYAEHGMALRAGDIVLAGSFTRPVDVRPGDRFDVDYRTLGRIEVNFS